jgi:hypothetical protein
VTHTAAPPPPAATPATAAVAAGTPAPSAAPAEPHVVDTPRLLNRWQLIGMAVAVTFGILASLVQLLSWQSDGRAASDTEQLVRVQEIQSSLLRADALATNAFLEGGLEPADQRSEYDDAIDGVLRDIAAAADAQPADQEALAALNVEVSAYANAISQARTNNRQGFPVGAEYLSGASDDLREEALPILEALVTANSERAEDAMGGQHPWWLLLIGLLALVGLWWINRELARHFRRRINVGIAVAAVIVLLTTLVTAVLAFGRGGDNSALLGGSFDTAVAQAEARTAANDAKANESLRLVNRGSAEEFEEPWVASAEVVEAEAADGTADAWDRYAAGHEEIVAEDDAGRWDEAVQLATADGDDSATAALDEFDEESQGLIERTSVETTDELRSGRGFAATLAVLTLLLGIVAAVFVARGIGERRREYA